MLNGARGSSAVATGALCKAFSGATGNERSRRKQKVKLLIINDVWNQVSSLRFILKERSDSLRSDLKRLPPPCQESDERPVGKVQLVVGAEGPRPRAQIRAETNTVPDCVLPLQLQLPSLRGDIMAPELASVEQPLHFASLQPGVMQITVCLPQVALMERKTWCFFNFKERVNSYPSVTSRNDCFFLFCLRGFVSLTLSRRLFGAAASFCILRVCVCEWVCVPVRELEIEPCNKCCAFSDRIAETNFFHSISAKENRTDVTPKCSLFSK